MEAEKIKVPVWFWVVTIFLLLWNLMGVISFFQHITISDEALQALPANERELYSQYPLWTKIAFALAVFCGFGGCLLLLLKKKAAKMVFIVSLVGIIIQMGHSLFIADSMEVYGPGAAVMPVMVVLIGIFLIWMSGYAIKRQWVR